MDHYDPQMTAYCLTEPAEWHGYFWLPTNAEHKVPGILTFNPKTGCRLVLVGSLVVQPGTNLREEIEPIYAPPKNFPLIFGECNDEYLSLARCGVLRVGGRKTNHTEVIAVDEILAGAALNRVDDPVFTGIRTSFERLSGWYGMEAVVVEHTNYVPSTIRIEDTFPDLKANWADYAITISVKTEIQERTQAGSTETSAVQQTILMIESTTPRSLAELIDVAWTIRRLISLSAAQELAPIAEELIWCVEPFIEDGQEHPDTFTPIPQTASLLYLQAAVADPDSDNGDDEWLFQQQIPFSKLVPRWFEIMKTLEVPINLLIRNWGINDVMVEPSVNRLSSAAEALSNDIQVVKQDFTKSELKTFKKTVLAQVDPTTVDETLLNRLKGSFPTAGGMGLTTRFKLLAERLGEEAVTALVGDAAKWAQIVIDARHQVAHALRPGTTVQLFAMERTLAAVIVLNLMKELGFDQDYLTDLARGSSSFNSARTMKRQYLSAELGLDRREAHADTEN